MNFTIQDANIYVMRRGKHQGRSLGEIAGQDGGREYLLWLAQYGEDRFVKELARLVVLDLTEIEDTDIPMEA